jgi:glycosyltransferase involved in cell wall biosynthesis
VNAALLSSEAPAAATTVVIATAARPERGAALRRAIDSVCAQVPAPEVVVVVNGSTFDPVLVDALKADPRIRCDYRELGSYPGAQRRGRELVLTTYFCFLDDDDELLPGSLAMRLARMTRADRPDVVVSSGLRSVAGSDRPYAERMPVDGQDIMLELLRENWLASPSALFRAETVSLEFFDGTTKYFEWTLLGFRLLNAGRRFAIVDQPGFRVNNSEESLSKNPGGIVFAPVLLRQLLGLAASPAVRAELRARLSRAHHACADHEWQQGHAASAWRHHLHSLVLPGGAQYLLYTRHLLRPPQFSPR